MTSKENQEVDITMIFNKIGQFANSIIAALFSFLRFLIKKAFMILGLIVLGVVLSIVINNFVDDKLETEIIVGTKVENMQFLYNKLEVLQDKLNDDDNAFLQKNNLTSKIQEVEIEPVIEIDDLLSKYKESDYTDEQVILLLENVDTREGFFQSELFKLDYEYHKITLSLDPFFSSEDLDSFMRFINNNEFLTQLNDIKKKHLLAKKEANVFSIEQIDSMLVNVNQSLKRTQAAKEISINSNEGININNAIGQKNLLLLENENIDIALYKLQNIVYVINKPEFTSKKSVIHKLHILLPVVFVAIYLLFILLIRGYKKYNY